MARFWRSPGTLMTAYVILFVIAGPWAGVAHPSQHGSVSPGRNVLAILIAAFLAWRVTRGGGFSRGLIIFYTVIGAFGVISSGSTRSGNLGSFGDLAIYTAQIGLLLSTPVYSRTRRKEDRDTAQASPMWQIPPGWMLAFGAAAGLVVTLLCLGTESFQVTACEASNSGSGHVARLASCATLAQGYPVPFLSTDPQLSLDLGKTVKVVDLSVFASPVIDDGAFALDVATWTAVSFLGSYVLWLPFRRPVIPNAVIGPLPT